MIYSRQGLGKTRLCLQLASALQSGESWLTLFPVRRTGRVVYLQLDMAPTEWAVVLAEAEDAGLRTRDLFVLNFDALGVNVFDDAFMRLEAEIRMADPIALIIDAGPQAFWAQNFDGDINQLVLQVLQRLRGCVPHGVVVYVLHDRKAAAWTPKEVVEGDEDAFAGPGAWERFAATSFRLVKDKSRNLTLKVVKTRFGGVGFRELPLKMTSAKYFAPQIDHKWMLAAWPSFLSVEEREFVEGLGANDVCRLIAEKSGAKYETVRRHMFRSGPYAWTTEEEMRGGDNLER